MNLKYIFDKPLTPPRTSTQIARYASLRPRIEYVNDQAVPNLAGFRVGNGCIIMLFGQGLLPAIDVFISDTFQTFSRSVQQLHISSVYYVIVVLTIIHGNTTSLMRSNAE